MWAIFTLATLFSAIAISSICSWLRLVPNVLLQFVVIAGVGAVLLWFALWAMYEPGIELVAGLLGYGFGCELYLFLCTLPLSSVSVNIMARLRSKSLSDRQLEEIYEGSDAIRMRIDRLRQSGLLMSNEGLIQATSRGIRTAQLFFWIRRMFHHH
jgi:hypothetical protein